MGIYPARFRGAEKLGSALCRQRNVQAVILMALLLFISRNNAWCLRDESLFSEYEENGSSLECIYISLKNFSN